MAEYGRFIIHGGAKGIGGRALDENFRTADDTLDAVEATTARLASATSSLSTAVAWLFDVADDMGADIQSISNAYVPLRNDVDALENTLAYVEYGVNSASDVQLELSQRIDSIVARQLPLSAIVSSYLDGSTTRYKAQYGDRHGVIADSTDAATVIEAALQHAASCNGRVYICAGTYPLYRTVSCLGGDALVISGGGATRIVAAYAALVDMFQLSNLETVVIHDIHIHGNKNLSSTPNRVGLSFVNCRNVLVAYCTFTDIPGHGIVAYAFTGPIAKNTRFALAYCNFRGIYGSGVWLRDRLEQANISGCIFTNNCNRADLYTTGCSDIFLRPTTTGGTISRALIKDNIITDSGAVWLSNEHTKRQLWLLNSQQLPEDVECSHVVVQVYDTNWAFAGARRESIRFTLADGKTVIPHSCKLWHRWRGDETLYAEFVLRIPRQHAGNVMPVYMYWSNSLSIPSGESQIWGDKYLGVWHMHSANNSTIIPDASMYERHCTKKAASEPADYISHPTAGQRFDGVDDYASRTGVSIDDIRSDGISVSAVVYPEASTVVALGAVFSIASTTSSPIMLFCNYKTNGTVFFSLQATVATLVNGVPTAPMEVFISGESRTYPSNAHYYVVGRAYESDNNVVLDLFVDGSLVARQTFSHQQYRMVLYWGTTSLELCIGNYAAGGDTPFKGIIDEVFLYKGKLPIARLLAENTRFVNLYQAYAEIEGSAIQDKVFNVGTGRVELASAIGVRRVTADVTIPSAVISGNTISDSGANGISLESTSRTVVHGNVVNNCLGEGISVSDSAGVIAADNVIRGCGVNGYRIPSGISSWDCNDCRLVGNVVRNCGGPALLLKGNRCVAGDNNTDDNCLVGEFLGVVTAIASNTITVNVTGVPAGSTLADFGFPFGTQVTLVWYGNDSRLEARSLSVSSINVNTVTLTGSAAGLSVGTPTWLIRNVRRAEIVVTGDKCYIHHNILRIPLLGNQPHHHHISDNYTTTTRSTALKVSDNDFVRGDEAGYSASVDLTQPGTTIVDNRGLLPS